MYILHPMIRALLFLGHVQDERGMSCLFAFRTQWIRIIILMLIRDDLKGQEGRQYPQSPDPFRYLSPGPVARAHLFKNRGCDGRSLVVSYMLGKHFFLQEKLYNMTKCFDLENCLFIKFCFFGGECFPYHRSQFRSE